MRCPKCGNVFEEGIFCPECGTRYEEEKPVVEVQNEPKRVESVIENNEFEEQKFDDMEMTDKAVEVEKTEPILSRDESVSMQPTDNSHPVSEAKTKNINSLGIASVVISAVGIVTTFVVVGIVLDVIGLIMSVLALRKKDKPKKAAKVGLVLSVIGIVIFIVLAKTLGF